MTSLRTAKRFVFPLLGLWVLLYASFSLVRPPLLDGPDALNAEIAREMLTGHHWVVPFANGILYAQDPPLLFWSVAASFGLFGVSDWAARLPVALAVLGIFIATFSLGRRIFRSPAAGFYAVLALITSYGVFLFGHLLLRDVFLCLWTTLALDFFWRSLEQERHRVSTALGFAACCALGVLTQGLPGLLFPLAVILIYLAWTHNLRHLLHWHPVPAVLLFLAMVLPWHIAAHIASGKALVGGLMPALSGGRVPLYIFWPLLLLWTVPWCDFSLRALRIGGSPNAERRSQARLLCLIWILVVLVFFSFAARQEFNLLSALPPVALLAGGWLAEDEDQPHHQGRIATGILFAIGMAAAALVAYFLVTAPAPAPGVDIATLLRPNAGQHPVFFAYFIDLTHQAMGAFRGSLAIAFAALVVGVSVAFWFRLRDNARMANCFVAGMMVAILIAAHLGLYTFSPVLSSEILAEAIKPELHPDDAVVINGPFTDASSVAFYLQRQVLVLNGLRSGKLGGGSLTPTSASVFIDDAALAKLWNGPGRVFLWTRPGTLPQLAGEVYVIGRSGGKEMVSNQPNSGGAAF
jgi:4-amino-4-deoxy-L-arabinose transferase-like glycosyltransferase